MIELIKHKIRKNEKSFINRLRDRGYVKSCNREKSASRDFKSKIVAMVSEKNGKTWNATLVIAIGNYVLYSLKLYICMLNNLKQ